MAAPRVFDLSVTGGEFVVVWGDCDLGRAGAGLKIELALGFGFGLL